MKDLFGFASRGHDGDADFADRADLNGFLVACRPLFLISYRLSAFGGRRSNRKLYMYEEEVYNQ
jgi:hypothetical protein